MTYYKRQYRAKPREEKIEGDDFLKCMMGVFFAVFCSIGLWILTTRGGAT